MKRFLWLALPLCLYLICTGCGQTFRPIIIPNPPVFPNPRASHTVESINFNLQCSDQPCDGIVPAPTSSAMVIDVSGDSDQSVGNIEVAPVFAVQQNASQVMVVNHSTGGQGDSLTELTFSGNTIANTTTISLPPNSGPNFAALAPSSRTLYVTLPNLNAVGVVNTISAAQVATIPVGANPDALAVTPDNTKLYVANFGDSTISGFNTSDNSQRVGSPASTTSPPIWLAARSDSQRVYILEQDGTLAWMDTTSTAGPDPLNPTSPLIQVPGATKLTYDSNLNRLYIAGGNIVDLVDVTQPAPTLLAAITIAPVTPSMRSAGDPCATTAPATLNTVDVAALPDGSRAYAGSYYKDASGNICPQVTVIDLVANSMRSVAPIPGFPAYDAFCSPTQFALAPRFRIMMATGGDSSRAYLSSCDGGNVNIIDTSTDKYISNLQAPLSSRSVSGSTLNPPQNPVFLLAGP